MGEGVKALCIAVALLCTGCLQSASVTCEGGIVCPEGTVCRPGGRCVEPAQVEACDGKPEGTVCSIPGVGGGICVDEVCVAARCGDGKLDPGEACDVPDPELCTTSCALPSCGDGIVQTAEACDNGAANADDNACTTRCLAASCGDGFIHAGVEECDDRTFNADDQPCTATCLRNVCGDSALWTGVEPCDDGNTESGDGCRADCRKVERCGDAIADSGEACDDGNLNPADGCDVCGETSWGADAILGGDILGTSVGLNAAQGVAVDGQGNVFIADTGSYRVRRLDAISGAITTVAGTGLYGMTGDLGPATNATLRGPQGVAVDGLGNLFIADTSAHKIRRVDAKTGMITTVAGTGVQGLSGDGDVATSAQLSAPGSVVVDGLGNLYIADTNNHRIRRVDATSRVITTVAGSSGGFSGDGFAATSAQLYGPQGLALAADGTMYIADRENSRIRRVDTSGTIETIGGGGTGGFEDNVPAFGAQLYRPSSVVLAGDDVVFVDANSERIRKIDAGGIVTSVAGGGSGGFCGDGGPALGACLKPFGVARAASGTMYIADWGHNRVRRIDGGTGTITTVAGNGAGTYVSIGDGGAASSALVRMPYGIAVDGAGNVFFADNDQHRVRHISLAGVITTVAGNGVDGHAGDGGLATNGELNRPRHVAIDAAGALYVTTFYTVRRVDPATGNITRVAGSLVYPPVLGDGGLATNASLNQPAAVAFDSQGRMYISDSQNHRIRRVDAGTITTIVGTGTPGYNGDDIDASTAQINSPQGIAIDSDDNLYIADMQNGRIRRVDALTTKITSVAASITSRDVAVDSNDDLIIADYGNRVWRLDATTLVMTTIAGKGLGFNDRGFTGDGGPAVDARIDGISRLTVDASNNVYICEATGYNYGVRRVDGTTGIITTLAGGGSGQSSGIDPEGMGPSAVARLPTPQALATSPVGTLFAGGESRTLQALRSTSGFLETVTGRYPHTVATANLARFRTTAFGTIEGVVYDPTAGAIYLTETSSHRIHVVTLVDPSNENTWTIAPLAGDGTAGDTDGTSALTARFRSPSGLYLDNAARTLYVADAGNHVIRAINLVSGTVSTFAGTRATLGNFGDGGAATASLLYRPTAITRCGNGDVFIADTGNHRVRRVAGGTITTVLGDGIAASSGDGFPATTFPVHAPRGLACDPFGNLFVTSSTSVRMVAANDAGAVDGTGAVQTIYAASSASPTYCLTGLLAPTSTTVQVTDSCSGTLVELTRLPGS